MAAGASVGTAAAATDGSRMDMLIRMAVSATPSATPMATPKARIPPAWVMRRPMIRRTPQAGHLAVPWDSGRWQTGQLKTLASVSPIAASSSLRAGHAAGALAAQQVDGHRPRKCRSSVVRTHPVRWSRSDASTFGVDCPLAVEVVRLSLICASIRP